ncbi:kinase-like domain-containing protein [Aspergillus ambiguus]|uniref:aminoglycoside phosphotransferase family protein n=1 Tax=Aspergillus ambiguus TaxID=176160 RepID=UPI003CCCBD41
MARVSKSKAAKFNSFTLKKLQNAIENDPEVDLAKLLPLRYSTRLESMRGDTGSKTTIPAKAAPGDDDDIRASLRASDPINIIFPLCEPVLKILRKMSNDPFSTTCELPQRLIDLTYASDVVWKGPFARQKMVFKCGHDIVLKAVRDLEDYTEYTTLQYIRQHLPKFPSPEPLGLVRMSEISLIFMTHLPSTTLSDVWSSMTVSQKSSIKGQLGTLLMDLRSLPYPSGAPLGGVQGEGCKDIRRHLRRSNEPITVLSDFEDFLLNSPHSRGNVFAELIRQLSPPTQPPSSPAIVFTHGDLRPDNIMVDMANDEEWTVTGLIDWEYSGFYPEYYEAVKYTNCLAPYEENDWFLFAPDCISPKSYAHWWLLDRVRETRFV